MEYSLAVIIPNYNKESMIQICIESVLAQTYCPNEIIVVDDCSKDKSVEIVRNIAKKHSNVHVVPLEKNAGVSNARNSGVDYAQSEYITFLDSDDFYYDKDKLKNEMAIIKEQKEKYGKDVVAYSAIVRSDMSGTIIEIPTLDKSWYVDGNAYSCFLSRRKMQTTPRDYCMKKTEFIKAGGYSYPHNFYEDLDLIIRLSKLMPFKYTGGYGTAYRCTPGGLSKRPREEHISEVKGIINSYLKKESLAFRIRISLMNIEWKIHRRFLGSFSSKT